MRDSDSSNSHDHQDLNVSPDPEAKTVIDLESEKTASPKSKVEDVPPDGGYGWVCVACCALINAHTWGVNSVSLISSIVKFEIARTND
jgi:hypothetical protein